LNATFTNDLIKKFETSGKESRAFNGTMYLPGIVGLNNIKANDYCNVVLQALSHVTPIRNYFLNEDNYKSIKRPPGDLSFVLVQRFGELIRKLWNPKNFKAHVSPHEMLQAVVLVSTKKFQITEQGDAIQFLSWLLNALHLALGGTKKVKSSVIYQTFRGSMTISTKKILPPDIDENKKEELIATGEYDWTIEEKPFMYLTADLPPTPLFQDEHTENIIPQVSLFNVLEKFNGQTEKEHKTYKDNFIRKFHITRLPPFIILYIQRFTKNTFYVEKNPTIVNFPIKSIEFGDFLTDEAKKKYPNGAPYDLIANVVHEGAPASGTYKLHILHKGSAKWFEMQDLHTNLVLPEILPLSEAYIQIYERRK
jgi:U4/U6.U5 tri-snRNP-associated protein 2